MLTRSSLRHACTVAKALLASPMALSSARRGLIPSAGLTPLTPSRGAPATDTAVAMTTVVRDADMEPLSAPEAHDFDELDRLRFRHDRRKADVDKRPVE
jgi:hypothetical protein